MPESTVRHDDLANAIRALAMDAVEKANSGHPGMPMGMADVATVLFTKYLKFDPAQPHWPDRDRFVLSAGHGSMLLYALLHLTGYAGHDDRGDRALPPARLARPPATRSTATPPASRPRPGRSARAWPTRSAWRWPSATSPPASAPTSSTTAPACCAATADLMEGDQPRGRSLAGHLRLNRLIVLYDDNGISIDGPTSMSVSRRPVAALRGARLERRRASTATTRGGRRAPSPRRMARTGRR